MIGLRAVPFMWVAVHRVGDSAPLRFHQTPGPGRFLYRQDERHAYTYIYAGYTHAVCPGCDTPQPKAEHCALCGVRLTPA
jgi:hypothetical protein